MNKERVAFTMETKIEELAFLPQANGLYYLDTKNMHKLNKIYHGVVNKELQNELVFMVETIWRNYEGFTKKEIEQSISVWHLQGMLGNPNHRDFLAMVCAQITPKCPFNVDDWKNPFKIFGKNLPDVLEEGYKVKWNNIMQDNVSPMKNGKALSSRKTKHINIRYFFIKDKID